MSGSVIKKKTFMRIESRTDGSFRIVARDGVCSGSIEARDPWEVRAILAAYSPDRLLLDLELPIRGGVELLQRIREVAPRAEIVARVGSRNLEPHLFSLDVGSAALRLTPLPASGDGADADPAATSSAPSNGV